MSQNTSYPRTPEEYQEEMMRLYRTAQATSPTLPEPASQKPQPMPEPSISPEPEPVPAPPPEPAIPPKPVPMPEPDITPETAPEPEPMPMPEQPNAAPEMTDPTPVPETPPVQQEQPAIGWIQVITRSAGNAMALPGVSVLITNGSNAQMKLEHVAVTDESGETEKIPLPVPAASLSLDQDETRQPYSTYDVSVYASGYYRQVSEKVPVFAGTTSRQIFSMIPLPSYTQEPPETITYQNTEPNL